AAPRARQCLGSPGVAGRGGAVGSFGAGARRAARGRAGRATAGGAGPPAGRAGRDPRVSTKEFPPKEDSMETDTYRLKTALAEMLKGGVILDVTTAEQARIAEDAGAAAVMALERVPADIRREGGVARMAAVERIEGVRAAGTIP